MWSLIVSTTLRNRLFFPRNAQVAFKLGHCFDHFRRGRRGVRCNCCGGGRSCWFFGPQPEAGGEPFPPRGFAKRLLRLGRMTFPSLAGLSPSADGLSQPFQQSSKVRHAFAEFTKLLLHCIKPGLQPIDPLIQPRLQPRHVLAVCPAATRDCWSGSARPRSPLLPGPQPRH